MDGREAPESRLWLKPGFTGAIVRPGCRTSSRGPSNPQLFPDLLDEPPVRADRDDLVGRQLIMPSSRRRSAQNRTASSGIGVHSRASSDRRGRPVPAARTRNAARSRDRPGAVPPQTGFGGTNVVGLDHRAHDAIGRDGFRRTKSAEMLRPRVVQRTVEDDVADVAGNSRCKGASPSKPSAFQLHPSANQLA